MYALEKNGPIIANRMREVAPLNAYAVVTCSYAGGNRVWAHRTLGAACRRLASVCAGKLNARDEFAAAIVMPDRHVVNYFEARGLL